MLWFITKIPKRDAPIQRHTHTHTIGEREENENEHKKKTNNEYFFSFVHFCMWNTYIYRMRCSAIAISILYCIRWFIMNPPLIYGSCVEKWYSVLNTRPENLHTLTHIQSTWKWEFKYDAPHKMFFLALMCVFRLLMHLLLNLPNRYPKKHSHSKWE